MSECYYSSTTTAQDQNQVVPSNNSSIPTAEPVYQAIPLDPSSAMTNYDSGVPQNNWTQFYEEKVDSETYSAEPPQQREDQALVVRDNNTIHKVIQTVVETVEEVQSNHSHSLSRSMILKMYCWIKLICYAWPERSPSMKRPICRIWSSTTILTFLRLWEDILCILHPLSSSLV